MLQLPCWGLLLFWTWCTIDIKWVTGNGRGNQSQSMNPSFPQQIEIHSWSLMSPLWWGLGKERKKCPPRCLTAAAKWAVRWFGCYWESKGGVGEQDSSENERGLEGVMKETHHWQGSQPKSKSTGGQWTAGLMASGAEWLRFLFSSHCYSDGKRNTTLLLQALESKNTASSLIFSELWHLLLKEDNRFPSSEPLSYKIKL